MVDTADLERGFEFKEDRLVNEYLSCFDAKAADFLLSDISLFAWLVFLAHEEFINDIVDVDIDLFHVLIHAGCLAVAGSVEGGDCLWTKTTD